MLVTDLKKEFYKPIQGKRLLIFVHYDLDGICAAKIVQSLFRTDNIRFTVVPVQTSAEMVEAFRIQKETKYVLLLNCGGCIDLIDTLQPKQHQVFYVADNHRPMHVCNIYSTDQVRVLTQLEEVEEVPDANDIFREESEDDLSSDEDEGGGSSDGEGGRRKRRRFDESVLEKRRQRRLWEEERHKLLFDYTQFSYYGKSTAVMMFELAWKLSKDNNELLWLAIIGVTEMTLSERLDKSRYLPDFVSLQSHSSRLNIKTDDPTAIPKECLRISFERDLDLALYRHWSMQESMKHSIQVATTLRLWTIKGEKRLRELLAETGIPLAEYRQMFCGMDVEIRKKLVDMLDKKAEKFGLEKLFWMTFFHVRGFQAKMCASDYVHGALALLEHSDRKETPAACFFEACDALDLDNQEILQRGIEIRKLHLDAIYKQVQHFVEMKRVICAGPFLYATVLKESADVKFFSAPHSLLLLATFTLRALVSTSGSRKSHSLPLIITVPDVRNPESNYLLVCGIPPVSEDSQKNLLGKAFEQAADKTNADAELNFFDTNVIRLNSDHRSKFFETLIALLS